MQAAAAVSVAAGVAVGIAAVAAATPATVTAAGSRGAAGAAAHPRAGTAPPPPKKLLVISDSTLAGVPANGTLDDLHTALPGWEVTFDARAYRNTGQGVDVAAAHRPGDFDAVVVGLGANDALSVANFSAQMARMLDVLAPVPRSYWLTLRESPRFQRQFAAVNSVIRLRAAATPNVEVADWNRFGVEHPEAFYDDGLHLTPAGGAEMSGFLASLVKRESPYLEPEPGGRAAALAVPAEAGTAADGVGAGPGAAAAAGPARARVPVAGGAGGAAAGQVAATIGAIVVAGATGIALSRRRSRGGDPGAR